MHRDEIDAALAARLVAAQFPEWAHLPVVPVDVGGWDNRTFRLGETMSVRLPTAHAYVASVAKEHTWLPRLAPHLPLPIPESLAIGEPGAGYPWPWSVRRWLDGRPALEHEVADLVTFAEDLARFLVALQAVDPRGGPPAGAHCFHRGGSLTVYDAETRDAIVALGSRIDAAAATDVWETALAATWTGSPVWFHGDVASGNLLVDGSGRLSALIDFGTCGVGDPACDLVISWTLLHGESRAAFRSLMPADDAMWARARGWAMWKALITVENPEATATGRAEAGRVIDAVLGEHRRARRSRATSPTGT